MKETIGLSELSKTLFIPLAVRARETGNENPVLSDTMAVDILSQCNTAAITIDGGEISTHGILARTAVIDKEVKRILTQSPYATVINLGAGLDTRYFRLDNGTVQWYDLDLAEVISLRKQFIAENERLHFISKSVLDKTWINDINYSENNPIVIIAEGLFMYFSQRDVKEIFSILLSAFPDSEMLFDVVHRFFIGKNISSAFLWGIDKAQDIQDLHQDITIIQAWSAGNILKQRQSLLYRLLNIFPSTRNRSQVLHLKLKGQG